MSKSPASAAVPTGAGRSGERRRGLFARLMGRRRPSDPDSGTDWLSRIVGIAALVALGIEIGRQFVQPEARTITVFLVVTLFAMAWRVDLIAAIGVLLVALPWPRATSLGTTNIVLVAMIAILWLLRVSLREQPAPRRTPVDGPIVAFLISMTVSFYNVEKAETMPQAFQNYAIFAACLVMFYLIVSIVRTSEQLERVHLLQAFSGGIVGLMALWELLDPGATVLPGWISFYHGPRSTAINIRDLRVGGPFTDFELFSEYCALNVLLLFLLVLRARRPGLKFALIGVMGLTWLGMFSTVTRGGIVALAAGVIYLVWLQRKRLNAVSAGLIGSAVVAAFLVTDFLVARTTQSGDLLGRVLDTHSFQFENGMPVARASLWKMAFNRMMEHPLLGHGPVYVVQKEIGFYFWPHNGYLYIGNLVGLIGLGFFFWLLVVLWKLSRPMGAGLDDPDYARAFLVIGRVQLVVFLVDQLKIDFMRNSIYVFQIWLLFAWIVAAHRAAQGTPARVAATGAP